AGRARTRRRRRAARRRASSRPSTRVLRPARPSVPAHRRIDGARPRIQTAGEVLHVLDPVLLGQVLGDGRAAHALVAIDDDLVVRVQLLGPQLDLLDRDVHGVLEQAELGLPVLSHVEQQRPVVALETGLQLVRGDLAHGRRSPWGGPIWPPPPPRARPPPGGSGRSSMPRGGHGAPVWPPPPPRGRVPPRAGVGPPVTP